MPRTKVWPEPLPPGTDVEIRTAPGRIVVGVISRAHPFKRTWLYRIEGDMSEYPASRVRPLDLTDPADVEVFLNG